MNSKGSTDQTGASLKPFERNNYFYGKLMMVRDFVAEQLYMNGERDLINRLVSGSGIVCGLGVTPTGSSAPGSVNIDAGVAIDCCGREIVVDQPKSVQISTLMPSPPTAGTYDLCLAYKECFEEPVTALANASTCEERCEYNRIKETYQLSLQVHTQPVPTPTQLPPEIAFWASAVTIYQDSNVTITRQAPQSVVPGQLFSITLQPTLASGVTPYPAVSITDSFNPQLTIVQGLGSSLTTIQATFTGAASQVYWVQVPAATPAGSQITVSASVTSGTNKATPANSTINVVSGVLTDTLVANYFSKSLKYCPTCGSTKTVVLATLTVDSGGNITSGPTPPTQFVYDNLLLYYLISTLTQQIGQTPLSLLSVSQNGTQVPVQPVTNLNFLPNLAATGNNHLAASADIDLAQDITVTSLKWGNNNNNKSILTGDQGGSIELGGSDPIAGTGTPATGTPYIDFHSSGKTEDFNTRIINDHDKQLSVAGQLRIAGRDRVDGNPYFGLNMEYFESTSTQPAECVIQALDAPTDPNKTGTGIDLSLNPSGGNVGIGTMAVPASPSAALAPSSTGLTVGTTYYYKITALDGQGETIGSTEVSATPTSGNQTINTSWTATTGADSYKVYRTTTPGTYGATSLAGSLGGTPPPTTFSDNGATLSAGSPPSVTRAYGVKLNPTGKSYLLGGNVGLGVSNPKHQLQLSSNDAFLPSSTTWITTSDERLKRNVQDYQVGLETLLKLQPKSFEFNGENGLPEGEKGVGLIAQEAQAVYAPFIRSHPGTIGGKETEVLCLNISDLSWMLLNSIRELDTRLRALESHK
jgi:hypothetical protein